MIVKLLLRPPNPALRLIALDGSELSADANGYYDVSEWPMLAASHPDWEVIEAFSPEPGQ